MNFYNSRTKGYENDPQGVLISELEGPKDGRDQVIYWDGHKDAPRGFGVRITSTGTRSFILRYNLGRDRRMTIGQLGPWTLNAAREQAGEYLKAIDTGTDILEARKLERETPTVANVVERCCRDHFDDHRSGKAARSRLTRYFVKRLGNTKIQDVRRADVKRLVKEVAADHGREAALLLSNIKGVFAWCEDEELITANPIATLKPEKVDKALKPRKRGRVLDDAEIRSLWNDEVGMHRLTALVLKLILVTGQRPGECAGMRWDEVKDGIWTIPATRREKTDTEHRITLTDTALAILEAAKAEGQRLSKRRGEKPGPFAFETRKGAPIRVDSLSQTVRRFVPKMENKEHPDFGHWRPHDLRRTMRTGLSAAKVPPMVAEITIGHVKTGIVGTYDLHEYAGEIQTALETWERRLLAIVDGTPAPNVTPLNREIRA